MAVHMTTPGCSFLFAKKLDLRFGAGRFIAPVESKAVEALPNLRKSHSSAIERLIAEQVRARITALSAASGRRRRVGPVFVVIVTVAIVLGLVAVWYWRSIN